MKNILLFTGNDVLPWAAAFLSSWRRKSSLAEYNGEILQLLRTVIFSIWCWSYPKRQSLGRYDSDLFFLVLCFFLKAALGLLRFCKEAKKKKTGNDGVRCGNCACSCYCPYWQYRHRSNHPFAQIFATYYNFFPSEEKGQLQKLEHFSHVYVKICMSPSLWLNGYQTMGYIKQYSTVLKNRKSMNAQVWLLIIQWREN